MSAAFTRQRSMTLRTCCACRFLLIQHCFPKFAVRRNHQTAHRRHTAARGIGVFLGADALASFTGHTQICTGCVVATIRRLRGRWQAMVRRKGTIRRCRSFDRRADATRWAHELEAVADRAGELGGGRFDAKLTLGELLLRYRDQVSPTKRGARSEQARISAISRRAIGAR